MSPACLLSYLELSPLNRYRPPLYKRPVFYVPVAIFVFLLLVAGIYVLSVVHSLDSQAATFDLNKLEQMESASVIVDRNDKIFGQIYVENRETIPYEQLPRDLVNAVVAVEDNKFYQHSGYDLFGIVRAALKNFTAGHVRQGASTITQQLARNSFALKERTFRRKLLEIFLARRIEEQFRQTEDHGAVFEPDLFRRRIVRRGGGFARIFRKTGARNVADGMRDARGFDQEPEQTFALDRSGRVARRAQFRARPDARSRFHQRANNARPRRRKTS